MEDDASPTRAQRLDPNGEVAQLLRVARPLSWLMSATRKGRRNAHELRKTVDGVADILRDVDRVGAVLSPLGWYVGEHTSPEVFAQAAALVEAGEVAAAELKLAAWYDDDGQRFGWPLRFAVEEVRKLYCDSRSEYIDYDALAIGNGRADMVFEALENHYDRRYASAITLAFAQIDGITIDFEPSGRNFMFFSRDRDTGRPRATLTDHQTLAGHPEALSTASTLLTEKVSATTTTSSLRRHGIMHGRDFGYDTRINSAKALALLRTTISWARPIAQQQLAAATAQRELAMTGVAGTDNHGRVLDRRGFATAKKQLRDVSMYQRVFRTRTGNFADSAADATHPRFQPDVAGVHSTARGENSFGAWVRTPSGWVLGSGIVGDDDWYYSAPIPPSGPPTLDSPEWTQGLSRKRGLPDWSVP